MGALFPILKNQQFWPTATKLDRFMYDAKTYKNGSCWYILLGPHNCLLRLYLNSCYSKTTEMHVISWELTNCLNYPSLRAKYVPRWCFSLKLESILSLVLFLHTPSLKNQQTNKKTLVTPSIAIKCLSLLDESSSWSITNRDRNLLFKLFSMINNAISQYVL